MDSEAEAEFWKHTEEIMAKLKIDDDEEEEKPKQKYDKEYAREYYKQNREMISARSRAYYLTHTEVMKKNNYVYMSRKIKCECGTEMIYGSRYRHMRSKIHFINLNKILEDKDELSEFNSETS